MIVIALSVLGIIAGVLYFVISHTKPSELSNMLLHMDTTIDVLLSDIFMLAIPLVLTWKFGLIDLAAEFRNGRDTFRNMKLPILVGVLWFLADTMLEDLLGIEMPEELQKTFKEMMHSPIGAFGICVAGPILEELLMRTAILGLMLRGGVKPWIAIVISALAFGLMHMNMAQFVFAGIGGLILGLVYYKTNNIFSVMIIHKPATETPTPASAERSARPPRPGAQSRTAEDPKPPAEEPAEPASDEYEVSTPVVDDDYVDPFAEFL